MQKFLGGMSKHDVIGIAANELLRRAQLANVRHFDKVVALELVANNLATITEQKVLSVTDIGRAFSTFVTRPRP